MKRKLSADAVAILKALDRAEQQVWREQYRYWESLGEPMSDEAMTVDQAELFARLCGAHTALSCTMKYLARRGFRLPSYGGGK